MNADYSKSRLFGYSMGECKTVPETGNSSIFVCCCSGRFERILIINHHNGVKINWCAAKKKLPFYERSQRFHYSGNHLVQNIVTILPTPKLSSLDYKIVTNSCLILTKHIHSLMYYL